MAAPTIGSNYIAWLLAHEYNFMPLDETMYDYWLMDEPEEVYRIANSNTPSNMLFLLDKTEFEW